MSPVTGRVFAEGILKKRLAYPEILNSQVWFSPQPWQTWKIISQ
jgi:hypothetical protein